MSAWDIFVDVFGVAAVGFLLIALRWAALERARIHHQLALRHGDPSGRHVAARGRGWWSERLLFGAFRFARRSRRMQVAVGAVAGWV